MRQDGMLKRQGAIGKKGLLCVPFVSWSTEFIFQSFETNEVHPPSGLRLLGPCCLPSACEVGLRCLKDLHAESNRSQRTEVRFFRVRRSVFIRSLE